jgi:hypothetical protein
MSTKRTPISRRSRLRVTPQMLELFRRGLEVKAKGADRDENGSKQEEYRETDLSLHRLLGLRPWHPSVFSVDSAEYPGPVVGDLRPGMTWQQSRPFIAAIRRELEAALAEAEGSV